MVIIMDNLYLQKDKIKLCKNFKDRLLGKMFQKKINNQILCFPKCNSIHTFFMFKNIDIIITDENRKIIKIITNLKPWKIIFPIKKAYYIYEIDHNIISLQKNFNKIIEK